MISLLIPIDVPYGYDMSSHYASSGGNPAAPGNFRDSYTTAFDDINGVYWDTITSYASSPTATDAPAGGVVSASYTDKGDYTHDEYGQTQQNDYTQAIGDGGGTVHGGATATGYSFTAWASKTSYSYTIVGGTTSQAAFVWYETQYRTDGGSTHVTTEYPGTTPAASVDNETGTITQSTFSGTASPHNMPHPFIVSEFTFGSTTSSAGTTTYDTTGIEYYISSTTKFRTTASLIGNTTVPVTYGTAPTTTTSSSVVPTFATTYAAITYSYQNVSYNALILGKTMSYATEYVGESNITIDEELFQFVGIGGGFYYDLYSPAGNDVIVYPGFLQSYNVEPVGDVNAPGITVGGGLNYFYAPQTVTVTAGGTSGSSSFQLYSPGSFPMSSYSAAEVWFGTAEDTNAFSGDLMSSVATGTFVVDSVVDGGTFLAVTTRSVADIFTYHGADGDTYGISKVYYTDVDGSQPFGTQGIGLGFWKTFQSDYNVDYKGSTQQNYYQTYLLGGGAAIAHAYAFTPVIKHPPAYQLPPHLSYNDFSGAGIGVDNAAMPWPEPMLLAGNVVASVPYALTYSSQTETAPGLSSIIPPRNSFTVSGDPFFNSSNTQTYYFSWANTGSTTVDGIPLIFTDIPLFVTLSYKTGAHFTTTFISSLNQILDTTVNDYTSNSFMNHLNFIGDQKTTWASAGGIGVMGGHQPNGGQVTLALAGIFSTKDLGAGGGGIVDYGAGGESVIPNGQVISVDPLFTYTFMTADSPHGMNWDMSPLAMDKYIR